MALPNFSDALFKDTGNKGLGAGAIENADKFREKEMDSMRTKDRFNSAPERVGGAIFNHRNDSFRSVENSTGGSSFNRGDAGISSRNKLSEIISRARENAALKTAKMQENALQRGKSDPVKKTAQKAAEEKAFFSGSKINSGEKKAAMKYAAKIMKSNQTLMSRMGIHNEAAFKKIVGDMTGKGAYAQASTARDDYKAWMEGKPENVSYFKDFTEDQQKKAKWDREVQRKMADVHGKMLGK